MLKVHQTIKETEKFFKDGYTLIPKEWEENPTEYMKNWTKQAQIEAVKAAMEDVKGELPKKISVSADSDQQFPMYKQGLEAGASLVTKFVKQKINEILRNL